MSSPFPGMDPYLENHWPDVHTMLVGYLRDAIQTQLPDDLVARAQENVYVEPDDAPASRRIPDDHVVESPVPWEPHVGESSAAAIAEPVLLEVDHDPMMERHVEILDIAGNRVVTAIEILNPWNKQGAGREKYLDKRQEYIGSKTNLVEIDLIRAGQWWTMLEPYRVPREHRSTYRVTIKRALPGSKVELYPIWLNQKLPILPIPLRPSEKDVRLELHALLEQVYRNGRYDRTDYRKPCDPPLEGPVAQWAEGVLKEAGRR